MDAPQQNLPPVANDDLALVPLSNPRQVDLVIPIFANDTDVDGALDFSSLVITQQTEIGSVFSRGTSVVWESPVPAPVTFKYTIADINGAVSNEATVTIDLNFESSGENNQAPVAIEDQYLVRSNRRELFDVTANDYDPDGSYISNPLIASQPRHGTVSAVAGGISYFHSGDGNTTDTFEYYVFDSAGARSTARVTVDIDRNYSVEKGMLNPVLDGRAGQSEYIGAFRNAPSIVIEDVDPEIPRAYPYFAIGHDGTYLYLYAAVTKPLLYSDSYPLDGTLWNDDSFEIYFDLGNEGTVGYDSNDFLRVFGLDKSVPDTFDGRNSQAPVSHEARCLSEPQVGGANLHACEIKFSLAELGLAQPGNREFGFDMQWNVDFDGGTRDRKLSFCGGNSIDAWRDMSTVLCTITLSD